MPRTSNKSKRPV
uniref:Uncharacterized protein n=1 Tax=Arundo donax TaxID=35708 RepID=A0A0A8YNS4_ARUDO